MKRCLLPLTMGLLFTFGGAAHAADKGPGPVPKGLVYEGALVENVQGKVQAHAVTYSLGGIDIAANLYTPPNFDPNARYAAIAVAHPNGGTKEQVAGLYAQLLAELGYVTIAADAAYQGASGGMPRHKDTPESRTNDLHGMVDYLSTLPYVDAERIGLLGVCGGGGYAVNAAKADKRLKALATLSLFNSGRARRNGYMDSQMDSIAERLEAASKARQREFATGRSEYSGEVDFDALTDEGIAAIKVDLYREGMEYYGRTHRHPNSTFSYTTSSLLDLMRWDATDQIELIDVPMLIIAGEKADSLYMSEDVFEKAKNAPEKELLKIPGATHIQLYHVREYVDAAMKSLSAFFEKHLSKRP